MKTPTGHGTPQTSDLRAAEGLSRGRTERLLALSAAPDWQKGLAFKFCIRASAAESVSVDSEPSRSLVAVHEPSLMSIRLTLRKREAAPPRWKRRPSSLAFASLHP